MLRAEDVTPPLRRDPGSPGSGQSLPPTRGAWGRLVNKGLFVPSSEGMGGSSPDGASPAAAAVLQGAGEPGKPWPRSPRAPTRRCEPLPGQAPALPEDLSPQMAHMCLVKEAIVPEGCAGTLRTPLSPRGGLMSSELLTGFMGELSCRDRSAVITALRG